MLFASLLVGFISGKLGDFYQWEASFGLRTSELMSRPRIGLPRLDEAHKNQPRMGRKSLAQRFTGVVERWVEWGMNRVP